MVKPHKKSALQAAPATPAQLAEDLAQPNSSVVADTTPTGPVRRAIDAVYSVDLTPAKAIRAMRAARDLSDVPLFTQCAIEALRQDPNLQAVLQARVLAVLSMPLAAEPAGKKLADRKASEAVQELLLSEPVESAIAHLLLTGTYLGFSLAQTMWNTSGTPWTVTDIQDVPAHYVVFDRTDAKTPYLLPQEQGGPLQPLQYGKFIYHRPGLIAGNPVTSGIAYTALFYYTLKTSVLRDWVAFVGIYGQPIRVGKYPQGMGGTPAGKRDLEVLKRALRDLGGDAWAMLPDSMQVEIIEAASRNSSAEVYERLCRFLDEQLAKLVQGGSLTSGTGNTGAGGSNALGAVHQDVFQTIVQSDAKALANTLRRALVRPFVEWNFGPQVATPAIYFVVEEQEDVSAWVTSTIAAMAVGLRVPAVEFYKRLDIREPEGDEEVLSSAPAVAAVPAANTPADAKSALTARANATAASSQGNSSPTDVLTADVATGSDAAIKLALLAFIEKSSVADLQALLTAGLAARPA